MNSFYKIIIWTIFFNSTFNFVDIQTEFKLATPALWLCSLIYGAFLIVVTYFIFYITEKKSRK